MQTSDLIELAGQVVCETNSKDCMYIDCNKCKEKQHKVSEFEEGTMIECWKWKTKHFERLNEGDSGKKDSHIDCKGNRKGYSCHTSQRI